MPRSQFWLWSLPLQTLDDLLKLFDPFPGQVHFNLKLVDHALFDRSNTTAETISFSRHSFMSHFELPDIGTEGADRGAVGFCLGLEALKAALYGVDPPFHRVHCHAK